MKGIIKIFSSSTCLLIVLVGIQMYSHYDKRGEFGSESEKGILASHSYQQLNVFQDRFKTCLKKSKQDPQACEFEEEWAFQAADHKLDWKQNHQLCLQTKKTWRKCIKADAKNYAKFIYSYNSALEERRAS